MKHKLVYENGDEVKETILVHGREKKNLNLMPNSEKQIELHNNNDGSLTGEAEVTTLVTISYNLL